MAFILYNNDKLEAPKVSSGSSTPSYAAPGEGRSPPGRVGDPRECWSAQLGGCTVKELLLQPFWWGSGENEVPMPQGSGSAPQGHLAVSGDIVTF